MKQFYSLSFIILFLLITSQSVIAQEDSLETLIRDTNDFIMDEFTESNTHCGSHFLDTLINYTDTQLGTIISTSFRITFDVDLMDMHRDPFNFIRRMVNPRLESIQRHEEWLERREQNTTQEEINEMREVLDGMEAIWNFCLRHPDKIVLSR